MPQTTDKSDPVHRPRVFMGILEHAHIQDIYLLNNKINTFNLSDMSIR